MLLTNHLPGRFGAKRQKGTIVYDRNEVANSWRDGLTGKLWAKNSRGIGRERESEGDGEHRSFHNYHVYFATIVPEVSSRIIFVSSGISALPTRRS